MRKQQDINSFENLEYIESYLAGTLKPVAPPKDFSQRLRKRIRFPTREELVSRLRDWKRLYIIFGSVMAGMLMIITIARSLYYLFGHKKIV